MVNSNNVLIGDFLKRIRRTVTIENNQDYKLLTIKMHHKGVVLRCIKKGSEIRIKKMYAVKAGDFILSGIDARNGAFGIVPKEMDGAVVTNDFWYFDVDSNVIDKRLFLELTQTSWFDEICRKGSDGTTQRIRLQKDKFFNQEILLPLKESHDALLNKIKNTKTHGSNLSAEIDHQKSLLKKFRQSILQDAISGKLTEKWRKENPDVEPATELLARIKVEKERLVKEKKIKKQKPLPPVSEDEIPFELPVGWVWTRLGEICQLITDGTHHTPRYTKSGVYFLSVKDISKGIIDLSNTRYIPKNEHVNLIKRCNPQFGDILLTKVGTTGIAKVIDINKPFSIFVSVALIKFNQSLLSNYFLENLINSPFVYAQSQKNTKGMGNQNLVIKNISAFLIPLPPLSEQKSIVVKLEELFTCYDQLEQQINKSQQDSDLLMQAVLQEAFQVKTGIM